jgi:hypothetical protein
MATEKRESFPGLEDGTASDEGAAQSLKADGSAAASGGTNYAGNMVAKDGSGNLQFVKVNANREVVVSQEAGDVACLSAEGTIDDGSASLVDLAVIVAQAGLVYQKVEVTVSCYRDAKFIVESVDDVGVTDVITELFRGRVGSGAYTILIKLDCRQFTQGSTGVQNIRLRAINNNALSDIDGSIAVQEVQ